MKQITIPMPSDAKLEYWRELTDANQHTPVRVCICEWLLRSLRRLGNDTWDFHRTYIRPFARLHKTFAAMEHLEYKIGHTPHEFIDLRLQATHQLLDAIHRLNPGVADAIRKTL